MKTLSDKGFGSLENVRACCDDRHTIGRSRCIEHHPQQKREPLRQHEQLLDPNTMDMHRPESPACSFCSRAGSSASHDGASFLSRFRTPRSARTVTSVTGHDYSRLSGGRCLLLFSFLTLLPSPSPSAFSSLTYNCNRLRCIDAPHTYYNYKPDLLLCAARHDTHYWGAVRCIVRLHSNASTVGLVYTASVTSFDEIPSGEAKSLASSS